MPHNGVKLFNVQKESFSITAMFLEAKARPKPLYNISERVKIHLALTQHFASQCFCRERSELMYTLVSSTKQKEVAGHRKDLSLPKTPGKMLLITPRCARI